MAADPETLALPLWIGGGIGAAFAAFWSGRKTKGDAPKGEATVLAASFTDPAVYRELNAAMLKVSRAIEGFQEQQHGDSRALRSAIEDMTVELRRNTAAQDQGAITPRDLAALLVNMKGPKE